MKIPGEVITKERVSVEVDKKALYRELLTRYRKAYSSDLYVDMDYIDSKNKIQKYTGDNHHNGNPEYDELREATVADIDAFKFKKALSTILL